MGSCLLCYPDGCQTGGCLSCFAWNSCMLCQGLAEASLCFGLVGGFYYILHVISSATLTLHLHIPILLLFSAQYRSVFLVVWTASGYHVFQGLLHTLHSFPKHGNLFTCLLNVPLCYLTFGPALLTAHLALSFEVHMVLRLWMQAVHGEDLLFDLAVHAVGIAEEVCQNLCWVWLRVPL